MKKKIVDPPLPPNPLKNGGPKNKTRNAFQACVRLVWHWWWPCRKTNSLWDDLTGRWPHRKMTSQEDDLAGRRARRKLTSQKDDLTGRRHHWKTTSQEDELTGRWTQRKMNSFRKRTSQEDKLTGRQPYSHLNTTNCTNYAEIFFYNTLYINHSMKLIKIFENIKIFLGTLATFRWYFLILAFFC